MKEDQMKKKDFFTPGKMSVFMDLSAGSSGKGMINSTIAGMFEPSIVMCNNGTNAGHCVELRPEQYTGRIPEGISDKIFKKTDHGTYRITFKVLPASSVTSEYSRIFIGPDAGFSVNRFLQEASLVNRPCRIMIHPRAVIVNPEDADRAAKNKHVSGTMSGFGPAQCRKLMRDQDADIADNHPELFHFIGDTSFATQTELAAGGTAMFELPQGFDLSLNHGYEWPKLTSRDITAAAAMNSAGISPRRIGKIFGNVRPYPIRVGNVEGESSGTCFGMPELTWEEIDRRSGADKFGVTLKETTTVTGRTRRVFEFSEEQIARACRYNEPDGIFLTFVSQIDYQSYGKTSWGQIPEEAQRKIRNFVSRVQKCSGTKVIGIATGPACDHLILL